MTDFDDLEFGNCHRVSAGFQKRAGALGVFSQKTLAAAGGRKRRKRQGLGRVAFGDRHGNQV